MDWRLRTSRMMPMRNTTTPAPIRMYPIRSRFTHSTSTLTANARIAPITNSTTPVPMLMSRPSSRRVCACTPPSMPGRISSGHTVDRGVLRPVPGVGAGRYRGRMPRTIYNTATTLDGFLADDSDSLDWLFVVPQGHDGFPAFLDTIGAIVQG